MPEVKQKGPMQSHQAEQKPSRFRQLIPGPRTILIILGVILLLLAGYWKWSYDQFQASHSLPVLTNNLKQSDDDLDKVSGAIIELGKKGPEGKAVIPLLLRYIEDRHLLVRFRAVEALGNIGEPEPRVVLALRKCLGDSSADVRMRTLEALENLGPRAKASLPEIFGFLNDDDRDFRLQAIKTVKSILKNEVMTQTPTITPSPTQTPVLTKGKKNKVVVPAAPKGKKKGKKAVKPIPTCTPILLPLVVDPKTFDSLIKATQNDNPEVRSETCKIIANVAELKKGKLGIKTKVVVNALIHLLSDPDPDVNDQAAGALENINDSRGQKQARRYHQFGRLQEVQQ